MLRSHLPGPDYPPVELVRFYHQRPTIEAFNQVLLRVLHFDHLRTRCLVPNQAMAQLGLWAYTFLQWARDTFFAGTPLEDGGLSDLVEYGLTVLARVSWEGSTCNAYGLGLSTDRRCRRFLTVQTNSEIDDSRSAVGRINPIHHIAARRTRTRCRKGHTGVFHVIFPEVQFDRGTVRHTVLAGRKQKAGRTQ